MIFIGGSIDTLQRLENGLVPKLSRYTLSYYVARSKREMLKRDQVMDAGRSGWGRCRLL